MLTGTWRGTYRYGSLEYPDDQAPVTFFVSITEDAQGRLTGEVQDSADEGGSPEPGEVEGKRRGRDVLISKTMPVYYMGYEDGLVDLSTWLRVEYRHTVAPEDLPPIVIEYSGTLDEEERKIEGVWTILAVAIEVPDEGPVDLGSGSGAFTMEKVSDETSDVTRAFGDAPQELKVPSVPVVNTTERLFEPDALRVELTETRAVDPCPCCQGGRQVRAGNVYFSGQLCASFLAYTTDGPGQHDIDADLIFGHWDEPRSAVSLIESETEGVPRVTFVDAGERTIAQSRRIEHTLSPQEVNGSELELHALAVWRAVRRSLT